jgi:hypothetical protein
LKARLKNKEKLAGESETDRREFPRGTVPDNFDASFSAAFLAFTRGALSSAPFFGQAKKGAIKGN